MLKIKPQLDHYNVIIAVTDQTKGYNHQLWTLIIKFSGTTAKKKTLNLVWKPNPKKAMIFFIKK